MWDILRQSLVTSFETDDLSGIADLDLILKDGALYLVATTRTDPGITVLELDTLSGSMTHIAREDLPETSSFPPFGAEILSVDGDTVIAPVSRNSIPFPAYTLSSTGTLGDTQVFAVAPFSSNLIAAQGYSHGPDAFFLVSEFSDQAFSLYRNDDTAGFVLVDRVDAEADVSLVATAEVSGRRFVFTALENGNTVETYEVTNTGSLNLVSDGGAKDQVGISGVSAIETVVLGSETYLLVAAFGSSSLTVLDVSDTGELIPTDHVFDRLDTRFARTSELKVVQMGDLTLVLVAGNDDGFSILQFLPNGRLILRATIEDATNTTLENVSGLEAFLQDEQLNVYVTSETEAGVTRFSVNTGPSGETFFGSDSADSQTGGQGNDVLWGAAGDDTLIGEGGDDVLSDGSGADQMTGGAGRDTFLLTQDGSADTILDFEPGVDQIDFSLFEFLFSVQGLTIVPTSYGATVTFAEDVTEIYRAGGGSLELEDLGGAALLPLSHGILPDFAEPLPDLPPNPTVQTSFKNVSAFSSSTERGGRDGAGSDQTQNRKVFFQTKSGDDALTGSDLDDTLNGGGGDDTLDGWTGNDVLIGSEGADTFIFGRGQDTIKDFDPQADLLQLTPELWSNLALTAQEIVDTYGYVTASALVLDFGDGTTLTLDAITSTDGVADQIIF